MDSLLAKLENDNKLLAELDGKLKKVNNYDSKRDSPDINADQTSHQLSTSMPSLTSSHLFQTSSLTDTGVGGNTRNTGSLSTKSSSNLLSAQNGKTTQQMNDIFNSNQDLDLDLHELELEKLKYSLLDDNDLLLTNSVSNRANLNKYKRFHSKSDGMPYHHNYDPIIKYSGALIDNKSKNSCIYQNKYFFSIFIK